MATYIIVLNEIILKCKSNMTNNCYKLLTWVNFVKGAPLILSNIVLNNNMYDEHIGMMWFMRRIVHMLTHIFE